MKNDVKLETLISDEDNNATEDYLPTFETYNRSIQFEYLLNTSNNNLLQRCKSSLYIFYIFVFWVD